MNTSEEKIKDGSLSSDISEDLINRIVDEVMGTLSAEDQPVKPVSEVDRIKLIKGSSVVFEKFDTGNPKDKVTYKEVLSIDECPNMATGFLKIDKSSFDWYLGYDELDYIIEGTLAITFNGKTTTGRPGDVIFIPKNTAVTFSSPNRCKFFYTAYPANWQDFCEEKK